MATFSSDRDTSILLPADFHAVESVIYNHWPEKPSRVWKAVRALPGDQRPNFLKFMRKRNRSIILADIASQAYEDPLDVQQYSTALHAVDWASPNSIAVFSRNLFCRNSAYAARPVYLGKCCQYRTYLQPEECLVDVQTDLAPGAIMHDYVVEMRSSSSGSSPFRFGYFLGSFGFEVGRPTQAARSPSDLLPFRFLVYLDIVDLDVWIIYDTNFPYEHGDHLMAGPGSDVWIFEQHLQDSQGSSKAMRIMNLHDLDKVDEHHELFDPRYVSSTSEVILQPWATEQGAVKSAFFSLEMGSPSFRVA